MMKLAIMLCSLMLLSACTNTVYKDCCPISTGAYDNPQLVSEFVANDAILKQALEKCRCE